MRGKCTTCQLSARNRDSKRDAVGSGAGLLATGGGHPGRPRGAGDRRDEPVADRAHRLGRHRGQVRLARAGLIQVDLLQREDVGVELLDGVDQPVQLDAAVVNTASVQDVEGGHPHGY